MVVKQADGAYRWVLFSSSSFQDRDGEIVSQKALQDDVDRADASGQYGPLRWWHVPGADIGDCDFNMLHGRVLVESGTFRDARVAQSMKEHAGELGVSIGFTHPISEPDADGVFGEMHRFERSLLPREVASNTLSAVPRIEKESQMTTIDEKLKVFGHLLKAGPDTVKEILALAESKEKEAAAAGTRFKELGDAAKPGETFELDGATYIKTAAGDVVTLKAKASPPPKDQADDSEDAADGGDDEAAEGDKKKTKALADELKAVLDQHSAQLETRFKTLLEEQSTTKAKADAATFKTLGDKLDTAAATAKEALDGVKELKGELPRGYRTWRASQDGPEPPARAKEAEPTEDPFAKHFAAFKAVGGVPAESGQ